MALFPVKVKKLLNDWPEKGERRRKWMSLKEAAKAEQMASTSKPKKSAPMVGQNWAPGGKPGDGSPEEEDEKPRILAFMCENDALPALDEAAKQGIKWNPWVRIIPVRCLGAINQVWIADTLSNGWDGIMLIGCQRGDDYQCHYMQGSELAHTRMGNLQETLERLALIDLVSGAARLAEDLFEWLDAPVRRLTSTDTFVGYAPQLEEAILPQVGDIAAALEDLKAY